jgi:hypothetical protein
MRRILRDVDQDTGVVFLETHRVNGRLHRNPAEGPAYVRREDGSIIERYYWKGRLHREDGPAAIVSDEKTGVKETEYYYRHGQFHRDPAEGAAVIIRDPENGVIITEVYSLFNVTFRDPDAGPCHIERERSGEITEELFSTAEEVFAMRRRLGRHTKASLKLTTPSP